MRVTLCLLFVTATCVMGREETNGLFKSQAGITHGMPTVYEDVKAHKTYFPEVSAQTMVWHSDESTKTERTTTPYECFAIQISISRFGPSQLGAAPGSPAFVGTKTDSEKDSELKSTTSMMTSNESRFLYSICISGIWGNTNLCSCDGGLNGIDHPVLSTEREPSLWGEAYGHWRGPVNAGVLRSALLLSFAPEAPVKTKAFCVDVGVFPGFESGREKSGVG